MYSDENESSGVISIRAIALVLIVGIVGVLWWMNTYGAGGAPQPSKLPVPPKAQPVFKPQTLTQEQMQERLKQDALDRRLREGHPPALTPEQERTIRSR